MTAPALLGWALANAHGHVVRLPGLSALPSLVSDDPDVRAMASFLQGIVVERRRLKQFLIERKKKNFLKKKKCLKSSPKIY